MRYIPPIAETHSFSCEGMIASSDVKVEGGPCNSFCTFWHICRDRNQNEWCEDKKY